MIKHVGGMTVAAHRGDCYNCYENTMTAFESAIKAGTDMIETDVHLSKDNIIFLMHDHTVDRTTNGEGLISDMTAEEINALNAGDVYHHEKVPFFEELLKLAAENNIMLNIEIKEYYNQNNEERCIKCVEDVIELIEKYGFTEFSGENVEFHPSGCVTFPILGTTAKSEDKLKFDPDRAKRRKIYDDVSEVFSDYTVFVGGSSSFDMAPTPYNKYYALDEYCKEHNLEHKNVVYIGDDYGLGGNDESVYKSDFLYLTIDDYRTFPQVIEQIL